MLRKLAMPSESTAIRSALLVCGLAFPLCGCVAAVPLAQMALSSAKPAALQAGQTCLQPGGCTSGSTTLSLQDLAKQFDTSVHKWTATDGGPTPPPVATR